MDHKTAYRLDLFTTVCYGIPMNKRKIILILIAIFIVLGAYATWYSFSRNRIITHNKECNISGNLCPLEIVPRTIWEVITNKPGSVAPGYIPARFGPRNDIPCNQKATTTPCSQITDIQKVPTDPIQQAQQPMPSFVFGSLSHIYTDKKYGFSFQYPDEIFPVDRHEGCIFFADSPQPKSALFTIQTPACSPDSKMSSFEDYRKDYEMNIEEGNKLAFHHLSSEAVKTKSGIEGIYQKFSISVKYNGRTTPQEQISRRYVFKLPQNGFIIFSMQENNPESTYYLPLEQAIIGSITFP